MAQIVNYTLFTMILKFQSRREQLSKHISCWRVYIVHCNAITCINSLLQNKQFRKRYYWDTKTQKCCLQISQKKCKNYHDRKLPTKRHWKNRVFEMLSAKAFLTSNVITKFLHIFQRGLKIVLKSTRRLVHKNVKRACYTGENSSISGQRFSISSKKGEIVVPYYITSVQLTDLRRGFSNVIIEVYKYT